MNNDVLYKTGKNISTSNDDILDKLLQCVINSLTVDVFYRCHSCELFKKASKM